MGKARFDDKIEEIIKLLEEQEDVSVIDEVLNILKPKQSSTLDEKLTSRALKSEESIKSGRLHTLDEVRKLTQRYPK